MPVVQARLDLPVRKTRSKAGKTAKPVEVEEISGGEETTRTSSRTRGKMLQPASDPETLIRTPRSRRKAAAAPSTPSKSPLKRPGSGKSELEAAIQLSPSKLAKTPLKPRRDLKENLPSLGLSPCSGLAKLALNSPRQPLQVSSRKNKALVSPVKKAELFSPPKMTAQSICDLLDSPVKPKVTPAPPRTPSRHSLVPSPAKSLFPSTSPRQLTSNQLEDLLCSPKAQVKSQALSKTPSKASTHLFLSPSKPAPRSRTPAKSPSRQSLVPTPTKTLFPTNSPRRITTQQLEDLLCSPAKSPAKLVTRSPRKPLTPMKHCSSSSPVKRTALFSPVKAAPPPPKPITTPLFQADVSQFQHARAALHTGTPTYLLCREEQVDTMSKWLDKHLVEGKPGSMYVSGAPGTGKTATLTHLLNNKTAKYKSIFINCMVLKSSIAIYREVAKQLAPKLTPKTEKDALKVIETAITTGKTMTLLVLDEVDQLDNKNQSVLYTVFEWPALQSSTLALVGIANSLDLTDRVLPRLQVSPAYKPTLLHYPPYTKQQIIDILTARLKEGGETGLHPVITPRAIAYLAGKISSLSGDLRKALDVCRRALELAETVARKQTLLKPMNPRGLASPSQSPRKGYKNPKMLPQIGQVDMPQIMKVVNQVYGSQVTASLGTKGEGLPIKQKILIASLLLMVKKGRSKEVTLGKLSETFTKILRKRQLEPEHESACVGMIEMLESRGMVSYACKGAPRMAKVSLRMDEDEVALALGDKAMLAGILEDVACIAK
eukprot:GFUD01024029.1.p1 GENE.GFUD01024029.1~~GFUD01024029.1.p1  ORF type:complete len:772 (-),score=294.74 GFUD01024029.1:140-2455(-)